MISLTSILSKAFGNSKPQTEQPVIWQMEADNELMELVDAAQAIATADLWDWCLKADPRGYTPAERVHFGREANMLRQWGQTVLY